MTPDEHMGYQARRAIQRSAHYGHIRGAGLKEAEMLFLSSDNPDTAVQFAMPITERRQAFRRGWALHEAQEARAALYGPPEPATPLAEPPPLEDS